MSYLGFIHYCASSCSRELCLDVEMLVEYVDVSLDVIENIVDVEITTTSLDIGYDTVNVDLEYAVYEIDF